MLEALGRVLRLNEEALAHLHALAADRPGVAAGGVASNGSRPSLVRLVEA